MPPKMAPQSEQKKQKQPYKILDHKSYAYLENNVKLYQLQVASPQRNDTF